MESNENFPTLSISQPLAIVTLESTASACHHCTVCPVHGIAPFLASQEPLLLQRYKKDCIPVASQRKGEVSGEILVY